MARTPTRRWKGCPMCKPHKHAGCGDAERKSIQELRLIGKKRRLSRHDLGDLCADSSGELEAATRSGEARWARRRRW